MKIGFVSSYPPRRCGIGTYTEALVAALLAAAPDVEVVIAAEEGAAASESERLRVVPCYGRREDYGDAVFRVLREARVDVVHAQHAPDTLGMDERLPRLLARFSSAGVPSVVTLHTVYGERRALLGGEGWGAVTFHRALAREAHIVVHGWKTMGDVLVAQGVPEARVHTIPHGTVPSPAIDQAEARRLLALPASGPVFLHFGFVHAQKNLHTALLGFLLAARKAPAATLVVAGSPGGGHWYNQAYLDGLRHLAGLAGGRATVVWRDGFIPAEDVPRYFAASDVVLLPHAHQPYGSASGVFHLALGAGRAVIASREPKFQEIQELAHLPAECAVGALDVAGWRSALLRMATDPELRRRAADALRGHAESTRWPVVAGAHRSTYDALLGARGAATHG